MKWEEILFVSFLCMVTGHGLVSRKKLQPGVTSVDLHCGTGWADARNATGVCQNYDFEDGTFRSGKNWGYFWEAFPDGSVCVADMNIGQGAYTFGDAMGVSFFVTGSSGNLTIVFLRADDVNNWDLYVSTVDVHYAFSLTGKRPAGASGATVSFDVSGGDLAYSYIFDATDVCLEYVDCGAPLAIHFGVNTYQENCPPPTGTPTAYPTTLPPSVLPTAFPVTPSPTALPTASPVTPSPTALPTASPTGVPCDTDADCPSDPYGTGCNIGCCGPDGICLWSLCSNACCVECDDCYQMDCVIVFDFLLNPQSVCVSVF